ncbi:hypothetical protein PHYPSEUDO_008469 [Phytophthora pseudosyringae]|uniref:Apple domain-containing protein n=1 Tax=Phytophthora pseudosyringae TaxID=221518 RepID=A0A8T1VF22_9STRA|nr:hypothetical protein PHYPSEUDO_008469 [Phytophthora pseudosyringae]
MARPTSSRLLALAVAATSCLALSVTASTEACAASVPTANLGIRATTNAARRWLNAVPPEVGVDYYGADIATYADMKKPPEECCNKCAATSGCAAFTFINNGWDGRTHCYLKSSTGSKKNVTGRSSPQHLGRTASRGTRTYYQCKAVPTQCSTQLADVDFYGNDLGVSFGGSPWGCCEKCTATSGCVGYTFVSTDSRGPACYLESGLSGKRASVGAVNSPLAANSTPSTTTHIQAQIRSGDVSPEPSTWVAGCEAAWRGGYNVMKVLGKTAGTAAFEAHRKMRITQDDIKEIAATGVLNTVRAPVDHWIGSQNGYEHSSPVTIGTAGWSDSQTNVDNSLVFATFLAASYKDSAARTAPKRPGKSDATGNKCILLVAPFLSEQDTDHLNGMIGAPQYENVWNEIHAYFIWGYAGKTEEQILADVDTYDQTHLKAAPTNNHLFLGDWCMGAS